MEITDGDLALFRERARTELRSGCDITRLAWDAVVPALCDEVTALRRKLADAAGSAAADTALATLPGPGKKHDNIFVRCSECIRCGTQKCHRKDEHWPYYTIPGCVVGVEHASQYRAEEKPEPQKPQEPKKEQ